MWVMVFDDQGTLKVDFRRGGTGGVEIMPQFV